MKWIEAAVYGAILFGPMAWWLTNLWRHWIAGRNEGHSRVNISRKAQNTLYGGPDRKPPQPNDAARAALGE